MASPPKDRAVPKIRPRLAGQHNYARWISDLELSLGMFDEGEYIYDTWDVVTGAYAEPSVLPVLQPIVKQRKSTAEIRTCKGYFLSFLLTLSCRSARAILIHDFTHTHSNSRPHPQL